MAWEDGREFIRATNATVKFDSIYSPVPGAIICFEASDAAFAAFAKSVADAAVSDERRPLLMLGHRHHKCVAHPKGSRPRRTSLARGVVVVYSSGAHGQVAVGPAHLFVDDIAMADDASSTSSSLTDIRCVSSRSAPRGR